MRWVKKDLVIYMLYKLKKLQIYHSPIWLDELYKWMHISHARNISFILNVYFIQAEGWWLVIMQVNLRKYLFYTCYRNIFKDNINTKVNQTFCIIRQFCAQSILTMLSKRRIISWLRIQMYLNLWHGFMNLNKNRMLRLFYLKNDA